MDGTGRAADSSDLATYCPTSGCRCSPYAILFMSEQRTTWRRMSEDQKTRFLPVICPVSSVCTLGD